MFRRRHSAYRPITWLTSSSQSTLMKGLPRRKLTLCFNPEPVYLLARDLSPGKRVLSDRTSSLEFPPWGLIQQVYDLGKYIQRLALALTNKAGVDCM